MQQINDQIFLYENSDIFWGFDNNPQIIIKTDNSSYNHYVNIDPFPCYYCDIELVEQINIKINNLFPIKFKTKICILSNEFNERTNGHSTKNLIWKDGKMAGFDPIVVLSGKRIPIHPAMTRYLIAHELGHIVDYYINYCMNIEENKEEETIGTFHNKYAKFRRINNNEERYSSQNWINNIGEIIANDFRIWAEIETEFWPHKISYPDKIIFDYWQELKDKYSYKNY